MNIIKLLCAPVVLAVAVVEDAVTMVPSKLCNPNHEAATIRAARFLASEDR